MEFILTISLGLVEELCMSTNTGEIRIGNIYCNLFTFFVMAASVIFIIKML